MPRPSELAADGVRELVIVAQDTTYYGMDLYGETRLAELLRELEQVEGLDWIRLMYLYPMYFSDELIDDDCRERKDRALPRHAAAAHQRRDAPADAAASDAERNRDPAGQAAGADSRAGDADDVHHRVSRAKPRNISPNWCEFVRDQRFERLGVFTYSYEPDTPAAKLPDQLPEEVKAARRDHLMGVQQEIAFAWNDAQLGKQVDVIIDSAVPGESTAWIGRSTADAPDVDGVVYVTGEGLSPGVLVPCEIVARQEYDLIGVACGAPR